MLVGMVESVVEGKVLLDGFEDKFEDALDEVYDVIEDDAVEFTNNVKTVLGLYEPNANLYEEGLLDAEGAVGRLKRQLGKVVLE